MESNRKTEFFLCLFLGFFGAHKFYKKKYIIGFLYFITAGILGIGWAVDTIRLFISVFLKKEEEIVLIEEKKTSIKGVHQAGLPIANGIECTITYEDDRFNFNGSGNDFNLLFSKITDICIKTDKEIQKQHVSSIGGAIAGNMVFGPLGAIVGGRAKEKKSTTTREYLIFTYLKEGKVDYISFEVTSNWYEAQKLIDKYNKNNKTITQGQTIEL